MPRDSSTDSLLGVREVTETAVADLDCEGPLLVSALDSNLVFAAAGALLPAPLHELPGAARSPGMGSDSAPDLLPPPPMDTAPQGLTDSMEEWSLHLMDPPAQPTNGAHPAASLDDERPTTQWSMPVPQVATQIRGELIDGRYEILGDVGCGGMSKIHRVRHTGLGK